jgi:flagellar motility protein MotE (MotC chaperone)
MVVVCGLAQFVAEQAVRKNATLKTEYDKVFQAVQEQSAEERRRTAAREQALDVHEAVDHIPEHIDVYKSKLREKEREVRELTERMRKLLASEHKHSVHERLAEQERARFESEIATLRMQVRVVAAKGLFLRAPSLLGGRS